MLTLTSTEWRSLHFRSELATEIEMLVSEREGSWSFDANIIVPLNGIRQTYSPYSFHNL